MTITKDGFIDILLTARKNKDVYNSDKFWQAVKIIAAAAAKRRLARANAATREEAADVLLIKVLDYFIKSKRDGENALETAEPLRLYNTVRKICDNNAITAFKTACVRNRRFVSLRTPVSRDVRSDEPVTLEDVLCDEKTVSPEDAALARSALRRLLAAGDLPRVVWALGVKRGEFGTTESIISVERYISVVGAHLSPLADRHTAWAYFERVTREYDAINLDKLYNKIYNARRAADTPVGGETLELIEI